MPSLRLITIPVSHFCEKARWALDRAGERYYEEKHAPLFHFAATLPRTRTRTVPILVTPHGKICDSTAILRHVDARLDEPRRLFPHDPAHLREVEALEDMFDERLGPQTRRWVYCWLLDEPAYFKAIMDQGLSPLESRGLRALDPFIRATMRRAFRVSEHAKESCLERVRAIFREVDGLLADGRRYLTGDRFTAADLTFASLAAPVLAPEAGFGAKRPPIGMMPMGMARDIEVFRATAAGAFALRLFREDRGAP